MSTSAALNKVARLLPSRPEERLSAPPRKSRESQWRPPLGAGSWGVLRYAARGVPSWLRGFFTSTGTSPKVPSATARPTPPPVSVVPLVSAGRVPRAEGAGRPSGHWGLSEGVLEGLRISRGGSGHRRGVWGGLGTLGALVQDRLCGGVGLTHRAQRGHRVTGSSPRGSHGGWESRGVVHDHRRGV